MPAANSYGEFFYGFTMGKFLWVSMVNSTGLHGRRLLSCCCKFPWVFS